MYIQPFVQWLKLVCNISVKSENKINRIFLDYIIVHLAIITDPCVDSYLKSKHRDV